ncbi:hypothetical protein TNCT_540161 [Trichonephila clavata]|uniref:Uncharacterized protein n=1 Tax=Trichonephila clavata TaxID=2740835 RepID=A0A8X6GHJ1_TRICU|nr:hypothetical protein TNCT_540161 [Trichonephila clavata]
MSGLSTISNDVEIGAHINGYDSIDHQFPIVKYDTSVLERRIVSGAPFHPDERIYGYYQDEQKNLTRQRKEYCVIHFFSYSYALLPTPCWCNSTLVLM